MSFHLPHTRGRDQFDKVKITDDCHICPFDYLLILVGEVVLHVDLLMKRLMIECFHGDSTLMKYTLFVSFTMFRRNVVDRILKDHHLDFV